MIIKKFQGKTEAEAILEAKEELGSSAIVMNIKTIKQRGIFRLFKPTLVEVTAALDEEPVVNTPPASSKSIESRAIEEKLNDLQNYLEDQFKTEKKVVNIGKQSIEKQPTNLKKTKENKPILHALRLVYNTLIENEVDETYCNQLMDEIENNIKLNADLDYLLSLLYQKMVLKFGQPKPIEFAANGGPKVIYFIGPTGVGKTTTIAKIASKLFLEEKKKVALLTADTYRIAAAEQLKTYANILNIPFRVVYTPKEINDALGDFAEYDIVLVDTAGHSYKNEEQKSEIKTILDAVEDKDRKEVYLVVSTATKYTDLIETASTYKGIADFKLIFTKVDETISLGNVFNLRMYTGANLSYLTCGQSVPDDIEVFDAQKIVKKLLGGK